MKRLLLPLLVLALSPAARAVAPADGGVEDLSPPTNDNELQSQTFACLMLSDTACSASANATPFLSAPGRTAAPMFGSRAAFEALLSAYPNGSVDEVRMLIGRPDESWIVNTCAIRLSYALDAAGFPIDSSVQDAPATSDPKKRINYISDRSGVRNGQYYVYRVDELARYMLKKYGKPQVWASGGKSGGADGLRKAVQGKSGVILFVVKSWSDATGHFDLWDGDKAAHEDYFDKASDVFLWR